MNQLDAIAFYIRRYCAPETFKGSLERFTQEDCLSLTITGIAKVVLRWIGLVPASFLDLVMGKKESSLPRLIANRTVYQLTLAKNTLVGKLPESLQKNWKSLALTTVTLSGTALVVYLRVPTIEHTLLTVKNVLAVAGIGALIATVTLRSLILRAQENQRAQEARNDAEISLSIVQRQIVEKFPLLNEKVDATCLNKFLLIRNAVNAAAAAAAAAVAEENAIDMAVKASEAYGSMYVKTHATAFATAYANAGSSLYPGVAAAISAIDAVHIHPGREIVDAAKAQLTTLRKANQLVASKEEKNAAEEALQKLLQDVDLPGNLRIEVERLKREKKSDQAEVLESFAELLVEEKKLHNAVVKLRSKVTAPIEERNQVAGSGE